MSINLLGHHLRLNWRIFLGLGLLLNFGLFILALIVTFILFDWVDVEIIGLWETGSICWDDWFSGFFWWTLGGILDISYIIVFLVTLHLVILSNRLLIN